MPAYRDEKLKTWYVKFYYRDYENKPHYTTKRGFKTKRDALNYEREFKNKAKELIDLKLSSVFEEYINYKKLRIKASTIKRIEGLLKKHFITKISNLKISELTPALMQKWQNNLIKSDLKRTSMRLIHNEVSTFLTYAVKIYGLKENPLKIIDGIGNIKREPRKINIWTYDEFQRFMNCVKQRKYQIIYKILFFSGLRVGELLALSRRDFNFAQNKISVTKNKVQSTKEISTPKTLDSIREIDMPVEIMKEVREYIQCLKVVPNPLFDISSHSLWSMLKRCAAKAGVKKIRVHDLRHSHASHLIYLGVPITTISRRLGHRSPKMTLDIYSHMYSESGRETAELLSEVIQGKKKIDSTEKNLPSLFN